ncbi:resistin-like [Mantella aurantiaca]
MKLYICALLLPMLGLLNAYDVPCTLDYAIRNLVKQYTPQPELDCTNVFSKGTDATCPDGYQVTGCACGMGCGSWNVVEKKGCHCQCANMDWTSVTCCRIKRS